MSARHIRDGLQDRFPTPKFRYGEMALWKWATDGREMLVKITGIQPATDPLDSVTRICYDITGCTGTVPGWAGPAFTRVREAELRPFTERDMAGVLAAP